MMVNLDNLRDAPGWFRLVIRELPHWIFNRWFNVGPGLEKRMTGGTCTVSLARQFIPASSGLQITEVRALPPIPTAGGRLVFWMSATTAPATETLAAGTGDDQIWTAYKGQTEWYPMQKYTASSGEPLS